MKTMSCYDCDLTLNASDREGMLNEFYTHYMAEHKAVIEGASAEQKKAWMSQFDADFAVA